MTERFETFTVLINRISRNIRKIKNREMAEYGLRSVHVSCLYYLYKQEGLTATDLCERCEEDKATISRALEYLQTDGFFVTDDRHGTHYRRPYLLTDKGRQVGRKIADKIDRVLDAVRADMAEEERAAFYHRLAVISDRLEAVADRKEPSI